MKTKDKENLENIQKGPIEEHRFEQQRISCLKSWRPEGHNIFSVLKETYCHQQFLYPEKYPLGIKGEIKSFSDEGKLREFLLADLSLKMANRIF